MIFTFDLAHGCETGSISASLTSGREIMRQSKVPAASRARQKGARGTV
jgi:hypothetical protein